MEVDGPNDVRTAQESGGGEPDHMADADGPRQRQSGRPLAEVGRRLIDFREEVGRAQWGRDPADDPEPGSGELRRWAYAP